ncbi:MAG: conjugal transfer pilus assembly protein TraE [Alteromonadaceae bacterium]
MAADNNPVDRHRLGRYVAESANMLAENKVLRIVLIAMVLWSAFNSIMLQKALDARTVVIMPPGGAYELTLSNTGAGDQYLYRMARYVTFLVGNLTAATARDQLKEVLMLIHPSHYGDFQTHFNTLTKEVERYPNISYTVEIDGGNAIDLQGKTLLVFATKKRLVGDTVTRKTRLSYEISFTIEAGRFWIMDVKEIDQESGSVDDYL